MYRVLSQYSSEHCIGFLGEDSRVQANTSDLFTPLYLADMIMEKMVTHPIKNIRRHGSDVYLGMFPVQNDGSYLMY